MKFLTKIYTVTDFSPLGERSTTVPGEHYGNPPRILTFAEVEIECRQYGAVTRAWYDVFTTGDFYGGWRFSDSGKPVDELAGVGQGDVSMARTAYLARNLYLGVKAEAVAA